MSTSLLHYLQSDPLGFLLGVLLMLVLAVIQLLMVGAVVYLFYFLLTLPLRRNERARLFLDVLELGLRDGRSPESAMIEAAQSRDRALGGQFQSLAGYLHSGTRLAVALERVPRLIPAQVRAMLAAGERVGDIAKVLPACRQLLRDAVSQVRGAMNYLILLTLCMTPVMFFVPLVLRYKIVPQYLMVFEGVVPNVPLPAFSRIVLLQSGYFAMVQWAVILGLWLVALGYVGGPYLVGAARHFLPGVTDGLLYRVPWRRKRLQRDFSTMLSVLLDAEVPEVDAVRLAAESTHNTSIRRRAEQVCDRLKDGVKLPDALRSMDDSGELHWRLANALRGRGGFLRALTGWHEALDARAFQLEQAAAQFTTTGLVLLNGAMVAAIVIAVFLLLIHILNDAVLW